MQNHNDFDDLIEDKNLHQRFVDKLNKDSEDMFYALRIKRRKDIDTERYQRLLIHHLLITNSNFSSQITDHIYYLIDELERMKTDKNNNLTIFLANELKQILTKIDKFAIDSYPTDHFKEVEHFMNEIDNLDK